MSRDRSNPVPQAVGDHWEQLLADAEATAEEYRADGWEPMVVHTADVAARTDDTFGLDVVAPDNEFVDLEALAADATFDESRVFRTDEGDVRFLLVTVEAPTDRTVVLVPAYLALEETPALERRATAEGVMYTHVRTIGNDARVTFSHDDISPFF